MSDENRRSDENDDDEVLTTEEAAKFLGVSKGFLQKARGSGTSPRFTLRREHLETDAGPGEAERSASTPATVDGGPADAPALAAPSRSNNPVPFLTAAAWSMTAEPERLKFLREVGALEIVNALKTIEPAPDLLNLAWKATGKAERQAFAEEHREEIDALAKAPGPTIVIEPAESQTSSDAHHAAT